jgi:V8-like Glu-specific endopeptidase
VSYRLVTMLVLAALVAAGCTGDEPASPTTVATTAAVTTTAPAPDARDVFRDVSPAIAFVETTIGTGSGILIEPGVLLTAAHVVWPQRNVRVVFPGAGSTSSARVIGTDLMADLALVDVSGVAGLPQPVTVDDGEALPIGSTVYMVGYPAESEHDPVPTISQGILSRIREWESEDWTFLQSDAVVVGGQSGGALVDEDGDVIGITNFQLATEYGLSGSIADVGGRIDAMKTGSTLSELGDRLPPEGGAAKSQRVHIAHFWDQAVFTFEVPLYTEVEITTNTDADTTIQLLTIDGFELAYADDNAGGGETLTAQTSLLGPHLVLVTSWETSETEELVVSSTELTPWIDPDDGRTLSKPDSIYGNIDFPGDLDWYWVELGKGQAITVEVDTVTVDPAIYIDSPDNASEFTLAYDDDSGDGPFGTNPRVDYTADRFGTYLVIVADSLSTGPGAYALTVE